ncbi:MAG: PEP-CTERM sorting domain-containing protein, partial [Akkermansia sp.]|nr:PEP-CTERM sorting domain-containing protein [Akkermansia sp.]
GTLNAGQIVVNSGVFVNKGVIDALETQQDAALMLLAGETEEYGLVINGGKVENFGTYEKSILVNGGTLTLEDKSKVASVTVDSGTVLVTGDSTLDSLTLNGDSTLNITYGASITLTDQDAFSLSENATIMVTVSKDMLENLDGLEFELFTHDVANLASANIVFTDGDQDTSNDVTDVTISQGGTSGSIKVEIQAIPEPTTATLSLLALCGLAARRRRK